MNNSEILVSYKYVNQLWWSIWTFKAKHSSPLSIGIASNKTKKAFNYVLMKCLLVCWIVNIIHNLCCNVLHHYKLRNISIHRHTHTQTSIKTSNHSTFLMNINRSEAIQHIIIQRSFSFKEYTNNKYQLSYTSWLEEVPYITVLKLYIYIYSIYLSFVMEPKAWEMKIK